MATDLRSNDTIQVRVPQGGGSVRDVPLSELNEYISTEEAAGITTLNAQVGELKAQVGDYDYAETGSTLTGDLATAEADIVDLKGTAPVSGAPITAQVSATAITAEGKNEEITWTAVANGEDGNGIAIDITLSAEATDIDIIVGVNTISVDVKTGEGITATDVLTAVNAHETAGLLVQGALTGSGGAITADSVVTGGGKDITAGLAGAIRYEADKIWISVDESTASVSNWAYASLMDPNA